MLNKTQLLDATTLTVLTSAVIPILTGFVTKLGTKSGVKAVVALFFAAVVGALAPVVASGQLEWKAFGIATVLAFVISTATHFGFYKPTAVTDKVQGSTANFGL